MKKTIALLSLVLISASASAGFNDNGYKSGGGFMDGGKPTGPINTVQQALKARDDTPVTVTGHIVSRAGRDDDEFIFRDATGEIKVGVGDYAWNGINITPNDRVRIEGAIDKGFIMPTTIDVYQIRKIQ